MDAMLRAHAEAVGRSLTDVINDGQVRHSRSVNADNRRGKRGRRPEEAWAVRCGMDPLDALLIAVIFERLGVGLAPAAYDQLLADHAIARGGDALKNVHVRTRLKSLRERPPAEIRIAFERARATLPLDEAGLRRQLGEICARIWPGGFC